MLESPLDLNPTTLPEKFAAWFRGRGWAPHDHQLQMLEAASEGVSTLLIAPTGGGKTLAGFLPSLIEIVRGEEGAGLHTLYISPLKALAVDIHRNLLAPIEEMGLEITCETRTGDTPESKRKRQRIKPPHILLTTPESLALLLSYPDAPEIFGTLKTVVVDELHALLHTKRGDLLALGLARLSALAPGHRRVGLSASIREPAEPRVWLAHDGCDLEAVRLVEGAAGAPAQIDILSTGARLPWSGHMALHAFEEVYQELSEKRTAILFVNTRAQAELVFQELWRLNEKNLKIALHHGSLAREQRRKVEAAMARGDLDAVVATSSLDLGVDWAAVDLVVQIGAPKGASRLLQRIGRANHRLEEPSRALLVPANRFEVLECRAALEAVAEGTLDGDDARPGGLDVLAQHILGRACSGPFEAGELYEEVRTAAPYNMLTREDFDRVLEFVATGGYALKVYEQFRRLGKGADGLWRVSNLQHLRRYRQNVGTIVEAPRLKVRVKGGPVLGEVEEYFANGLVPGDTFIFSGRRLAFIGIREETIMAQNAKSNEPPKVPAYVGGRLPLSTHLSDRVRAILSNPTHWAELPKPVREWLAIQRWASVLPSADGLLVETFPRGEKEFLVAYCFAGRNAHQTLGMLLTRRMERIGLGPLGFVASDYVIAIWSLRTVEDVDALFDEDMLGDDLEEWMAESSMLRRTFRNIAVIAGLIDQRVGGRERRGREMTISADLIYDVLRRHQPDHILLEATQRDAAGGLTDIGRLAELLGRVKGKIDHRRLERVSPLAVPILLEIGREQVAGSALDELLDEGAQDLIDEVMEQSQITQSELPI